MGPFEAKLREILGEDLSGELLNEAVEKVLVAHCDVYALYSMSELMAAEIKVSEMAKKRKTTTFQFYQGKIQAFQELFMKVAFDVESVEDDISDEDLAEAKKFWRKAVEVITAQAIGA